MFEQVDHVKCVCEFKPECKQPFAVPCVHSYLYQIGKVFCIAMKIHNGHLLFPRQPAQRAVATRRRL